MEITILTTNRNRWLYFVVLSVLFTWVFTASIPVVAQEPIQDPAPAAPGQTSTQAAPATPKTDSPTPQAQVTDPQPQQNNPQNQAKPNSSSSGAGTEKNPSSDPNVPRNDRILWTLPNFLTVENASSLPPLTVKQKFKLVAQGTFDPVEFAFLALEAGVNQASNTNPTFGQGFKGYGKRYALAFADNGVENFMTGAVFPSLLRQDPRYFQLGKGSFFHRAGYAAARVFITRGDSGKSEFNYSEIFGAATAAGISNAYHPGPRTLGSNISVWWTQIGWDAVSFEMKEFWPDIRHYLTGHNQNK